MSKYLITTGYRDYEECGNDPICIIRSMIERGCMFRSSKDIYVTEIRTFGNRFIDMQPYIETLSRMVGDNKLERKDEVIDCEIKNTIKANIKGKVSFRNYLNDLCIRISSVFAAILVIGWIIVIVLNAQTWVYEMMFTLSAASIFSVMYSFSHYKGTHIQNIKKWMISEIENMPFNTAVDIDSYDVGHENVSIVHNDEKFDMPLIIEKQYMVIRRNESLVHPVLRAVRIKENIINNQLGYTIPSGVWPYKYVLEDNHLPIGYKAINS